LSAAITGMEFARPMSPQFAAGLLHALGGRVRQVRIDRLLPAFGGGTAYGATVEVESASGLGMVDARPSDVLNLVAVTSAPIFAAPEVLAEAEARREGDSDDAILLRRTLDAEQMTVRQGAGIPASVHHPPDAPTTWRPELAGLDRQGRTPLQYAALANDADAVSRLLTEGADASVPDRQGFTASHFAAQQGAVAAAEALLSAGAQVDAVNSFGNTPLSTAAFYSRGRGELIRLLRRHGADPWHPNSAGQTPVSIACLIANYDVAQFFADLTDPDPNT